MGYLSKLALHNNQMIAKTQGCALTLLGGSTGAKAKGVSCNKHTFSRPFEDAFPMSPIQDKDYL